MKEKKYVAYTDGSFKPSSNRGGWASIIFDNENNEIIKLHNGMIGTSNNRMEIMAVLETLKWFKQPSDLIIISDSMYVVNTINQGWIKKWFIEKDFSKETIIKRLRKYSNLIIIALQWSEQKVTQITSLIIK